jgi:hypothetical protein
VLDALPLWVEPTHTARSVAPPSLHQVVRLPTLRTTRCLLSLQSMKFRLHMSLTTQEAQASHMRRDHCVRSAQPVSIALQTTVRIAGHNCPNTWLQTSRLDLEATCPGAEQPAPLGPWDLVEEPFGRIPSLKPDRALPDHVS